MNKLKGTKKGRRGERKSSPRRVEAATRVVEAINLRIAGVKYRDIAAQTGYNSPQACQKAVTENLARSVREPAAELIELELHRLDSLFLSVYSQARRGILGAVDRCIRIMDRRARLLGLDAPIALSVNWREEAEKAGLKASDEFEELVARIISDNAQRVGKLPGGEPDGG